MPDNPKRTFVEMVGRLSRETQLHIDERQYHFEINKKVVMAVSVILMVIAVINVYLVKNLYVDLTGIITNMESMHVNMGVVSDKMLSITNNVVKFADDMKHMDTITDNTAAMSTLLPEISGSMHDMANNIQSIDNDMASMSTGMVTISQRFKHMTGGVANMRQNVRTISRPMGAMNPFMP